MDPSPLSFASHTIYLKWFKWFVTEGILQSAVRIVSELEAGDDDEVHGDLDQDQRQEPEDALAAHHLQRVRVVLGDELLLVHKLARGNNLTTTRYLSKHITYYMQLG